nr:MAG TPA: hypothetical protein [Bacteriophage sp.]
MVLNCLNLLKFSIQRVRVIGIFLKTVTQV